MAAQGFYGDYQTNPSNPYYLHPNESPNLVLVNPPMDGKNYHVWARSMKLALLSKNKEQFIEGNSLQPSTADPLYAQWKRCNTMVLSWIHHSISKSIVKSIVWIDKAYDAWKDLQDRFSQGDIFRISEIQDDMCKLQQGTLNVSDYFTQLKILWDELENFRPLPHCNCAIPCSCGAIEDMKKYRNQDYTIRFLKGLNEQYSHVRSQIMLMDPLPVVAKTFSLIIQQERQLDSEINRDAVTESKAFALNSGQGGYSHGRGFNSNRGDYSRGRGNYGRGRSSFGRGQG